MSLSSRSTPTQFLALSLERDLDALHHNGFDPTHERRPIPQTKSYATGSQSGRAYLVLLILHELVDEVRADEARPTSDQDPQVGLDQTAIRHRQSGSGAREPTKTTRRGRRSGDGIARSPGRTWRSGAARGSAAGGRWCARRCCHWSPSAPSRRAPGSAQIQPKPHASGVR
jgi:hypothetical protein